MVTAAFTVVLGIATVRLWKSTDKLWNASEKQTRVALITTRAAARAASKQLRLSESSTEKQLRAYVGIESIVLDAPNIGRQDYKPHVPKAGSRSPDTLRITIRNFGATPANEVIVWANWVSTDFGARLPDAFGYPDFGVGDKGPNGLRTTLIRPTVFPQQVWPQDIGIDDLAPFVGANRREANTYVYGHINYRDMLGTHRTTDFCFSYDPEEGGGAAFTAYEQHNEAK